MANWREIAGYEGMYLVSDEGQVVSLPRKIKSGNKILFRKGKSLKPNKRGRCGLFYDAVALSKDGKTVWHSVHRLVAEAFIPNPDNLPEVNHIDKNPMNNRADNLEWCTKQYNIEFSKNLPIYQFKDNGEICRFKSITDASRQTGICRTAINNALKGRAITAGGFRWAYCE